MINLLLFGAGVYVQGSHLKQNDLGNIGSSLVEGFHQGLISKVFIKATSSSSSTAAQKINHIVGNDFAISCQDDNIDRNFVIQNNISAAIIALPDFLHYEYLIIWVKNSRIA